ncbi:unnamed protein product [Closterium sp. NIES-64]|nr:unnamed protein product [Closterium sp. NIES-64]
MGDPSANPHSKIAEAVFAHKAAWSGPIIPSARPDIIVAQDGSGNFKTIQEAINYVTPYSVKPVKTIIFVKAGTYFEEVIIPATHRFITLIGEPGLTRVKFNKYSAKLDANGDPIGTAGTGTLAALGDDFTMINMIVENSSPRPPPATVGFQAVAFRASGNRTLVYNCSFYSYQDTLYAHEGFQYYKDCYIFGEMDFVFGKARAVFESCTFYMDSMGTAAVTAQKRDFPSEDTCFVIMNSHITGKNQGWLGRAWGKYACTIVAYSSLDNVVAAEGWNDFTVPARRLTTFYSEYKNRGIGSVLEGRVWWQRVMSARQVKKYLTTDYIGLGTWLPQLPVVNRNVATPKLVPKTPPANAKWRSCQLDEDDLEDSQAKKNKKCSKCCMKKALLSQRRDCMNYCMK